MATVNKLVGYTRVKKERSQFTWIINDFNWMKAETGEPIMSPKFRVEGDIKRQYWLTCYPGGYRKDDSGYISLFLECDTTEEVAIECKISLTNGQSVFSNDRFLRRLEPKQRNWGWSKYIRAIAVHESISPSNKLTIICDLTVATEFQVFTRAEPIESRDEFHEEVKTMPTHDWLFRNEEFSDMQICGIDGAPVPGHRVVLATASPVFKYLVEAGKGVDVVFVNDIYHDVLMDVLQFVYTGDIRDEIVNNPDMVCKLFAAAVQLKLDALRYECEEILCDHLSIESVLEILSFAYQHQAEKLKKRAIDFTVSHMEELEDQMKRYADPFMLDLIRSLQQNR
ncbi:speckle-type POZ protein-like [Trichogramma pretiosum]|uniref:speckle-type POZ protein-like n=1 Tax=Trichogramma pretiosum TaxID=7493 RepID=UPI0006C9CDCE|nr:speckle-type POZ protein-like [Trichogramma pretiosum]